MKKLDLVHDTSTPELIEVGLQLENILASEEMDEKILLELIVQRDELIISHLAKLDEKSMKTFATAELEINQRLTSNTKKLLKNSLNQISSYLRGKKAVSKYK